MIGKLQIENCKLRIANWRALAASPLQTSRQTNLQFAVCNLQFAIILSLTAIATAGCNRPSAPAPAAATSGASPPSGAAFAADPPARSRPVAPGPESWPSFRRDLLQTGVAATKLPEKLERLW